MQFIQYPSFLYDQILVAFGAFGILDNSNCWRQSKLQNLAKNNELPLSLPACTGILNWYALNETRLFQTRVSEFLYCCSEVANANDRKLLVLGVPSYKPWRHNLYREVLRYYTQKTYIITLLESWHCKDFIFNMVFQSVGKGKSTAVSVTVCGGGAFSLNLG